MALRSHCIRATVTGSGPGSAASHSCPLARRAAAAAARCVEADCEPALRASISAPSNSLLPPNPPRIGRHSQGLGSHASHLPIREGAVWRKPRTGTSASFASFICINAELLQFTKDNGCHCLSVEAAVLLQCRTRRHPLSFEANHSRVFSLAARSAIR